MNATWKNFPKVWIDVNFEHMKKKTLKIKSETHIN